MVTKSIVIEHASMGWFVAVLPVPAPDMNLLESSEYGFVLWNDNGLPILLMAEEIDFNVDDLYSETFEDAIDLADAWMKSNNSFDKRVDNVH